jgi:hypothetical protein
MRIDDKGFTTEELKNEHWKKIPGTDWEASSLGRIKIPETQTPYIHGRWNKAVTRRNPGRITTGRVKSNGYKAIYTGGESEYVHRLVLMAFSGPPKKNQVTRHLDGDKHNNRIENLVWGTQKENSLDRKLHGTHLIGESCPWAKLTEEDVKEIKRRLGNGELGVSVSQDFGISNGHTSNIKNGIIWNHVKV